MGDRQSWNREQKERNMETSPPATGWKAAIGRVNAAPG